MRVRTPHAAELVAAAERLGGRIEEHDGDTLEIAGIPSDEIGRAAAASGIVLFELTPHQASLEEAFMEMTKGELEYGHVETPA